MELTDRQQEILAELVDGYRSTEEPMTGEDVAEAVGRTTGSVRGQMQSLTALNLVEGIPGPGGGYKPTVNAYEALDEQSLDDAESLVLAREYERRDVVVDEIDFVDVNHPEECRARLTLDQPVTQFEVGDAVVVGPTPRTRLVVAGQVESFDEGTNELRLDVAKLEAPLEA
ncbi:TrmB family transcriptional regulator [Haloplanus sp. GCM10025708]|uniref:TrmB family transcriptional regulator n=1 Tax=Haloferacaceae TaxID=1644056 RepID=UPI0036152B8E